MRLFALLVASSFLAALACSAPMPANDDDEITKRGGGGDRKDDKKRDASAPSKEEDDDALPPSTPPGPKDAGTPVDSGRAPQGEPTPAPTGTSPAPNTPLPRPATPFLALDVRYPVEADRYITQCTPDATTQLVWTTTAQGRDADSRWASASYKEKPGAHYACGTKTNGEYPIVMSWTADAVPLGTWVVRCVGSKMAHVYKITGAHAGHPAATYQYAEPYASCP